eukprot:gene9760-11397_t
MKVIKEEEAKMIHMKKVFDVSQISDPITLNIGGKVYSTSLATLTSVKGSYFDVMFNGSLTPKPMANTTNTYFIDRDGKHFRHILNMLRGKKTDIPREIMVDLEDELSFYGLRKLDPELSFESVIINKAQSKVLLGWCGVNKKLELIYRKCDNQGPTITIIKSSNNYIFGGYASQSWNSTGTYYGDVNCWLYTLYNNNITAPTKYIPKTTANFQYGMTSYGPTFGGGHDLNVTNLCNTNQSSYSNFPHTYNDTTGQGNITFAGARNFTVSDYEVFKLI